MNRKRSNTNQLFLFILLLLVVAWPTHALSQSDGSNSDAYANCAPRAALAVNGQVVSRSFVYDDELGQNQSENFESVSAAALTSSLLTQYFLPGPITLFEPSQLEREILRQQTPQTPEQLETIITTDEAEFIINVIVSVATQPFQLANGLELFDSRANVILTVFKSASGGEIIAEERFEGRSRLDYPSAEAASQEAIERALQSLTEQSLPANTRNSSLNETICKAYSEGAGLNQTTSMRIDVNQLSSFDQVSSINAAITENVPNLVVATYTFNVTTARFTVTVPATTNIDAIIMALSQAAAEDDRFPEVDVVERQDTFLELEVKRR